MQSPKLKHLKDRSAPASTIAKKFRKGNQSNDNVDLPEDST